MNLHNKNLKNKIKLMKEKKYWINKLAIYKTNSQV